MMELKKDINNADVVLIGVFGLIILLNALKPWIDYWTPLHYQVITAFQFLLLTFTVTFLNKNFYKKISFLGAVLLLFILIRFFAETLIDLLEGDVLGIVGSLYVVVLGSAAQSETALTLTTNPRCSNASTNFPCRCQHSSEPAHFRPTSLLYVYGAVYPRTSKRSCGERRSVARFPTAMASFCLSPAVSG